MCGPDSNAAASRKRRSSSLLLTHESFVFSDIPDKDDENKHKGKNPHIHGLGGPSLASTILTVSFYVAILFLTEHLCRLFIAQYAHLDPVLENETNRHILARHIGVDFTSLLFCAYIAVTNRHACKELFDHGMAYGKSDFMGDDTFEDRVFKYHPAAQRLLTIFFVYQVKNMYDTIIWGDGIEFILHHLLAGAAAWTGMFPGCCHFYAIFFFGLSEISTAILCLLANFDPDFGVIGLEKVFPVTKFILGGLFVTSFIVCRLIMWPFISYYISKDILKAIRGDHPRANGRRGVLWLILICCWGLTAIQGIFVHMIYKTGKEEFGKLMEMLQ